MGLGLVLVIEDKQKRGARNQVRSSLERIEAILVMEGGQVIEDEVGRDGSRS